MAPNLPPFLIVHRFSSIFIDFRKIQNLRPSCGGFTNELRSVLQMCRIVVHSVLVLTSIASYICQIKNRKKEHVLLIFVQVLQIGGEGGGAAGCAHASVSCFIVFDCFMKLHDFSWSFRRLSGFSSFLSIVIVT